MSHPAVAVSSSPTFPDGLTVWEQAFASALCRTVLASPSMAADDAGSPLGGDGAAGSEEDVASVQHTQPPLLSVVKSVTEPKPSAWRLEGEVLMDIAIYAQSRALSLPTSSAVRDEVLQSAEELRLLAALRGVQGPALESA